MVSIEEDIWRLKVVTPPTAEIATVEDLRAQARIDAPDEDVIALRFIAAARWMLEVATRRCFLQTTLAASKAWFPGGVDAIELPRAPVSSVTSITYRDSTGAVQTLAGSEYSVDLGGEPGLIIPEIDASWPTTDGRAGALTVTFVAGVASATDVPALAVQAVAMLAAHWFLHRELEGVIPTDKQEAWDRMVNLLRW
jgi:uncharacterized phiE125 gp8 family phage protein